MRLFVTAALVAAAALFTASSAQAQVDCVAPMDQQDSVATATFAPVRQTLLTIERIIQGNAAYQQPPEPVRMRTMIAAGPSETGGARIFVRAYPEVQTTAKIQIWTRGRCDVIPQADRVAAGVGDIYAFVNYSVQEQFLGGHAVPTYQGEVAGYPIYNNWVVMTKDRRLPWIPQTLRDRLDQEEQKRQRAIEDWERSKASLKTPNEAAQRKTYEMLKASDPAGAEKFLATSREIVEQVRKARAEEPKTDAHLQRQLRAVRDYRASFSAADLDGPAEWMDASREDSRRLDARIAELQKLPPDLQQQSDSLGREARDLERQARTLAATDKEAAAALRERAHAIGLKVREIRKAHLASAYFDIQTARGEYELTNLKPGPKERAMAFKPDPSFPDFRDPFRPQLITVGFWSKSDPKDNSPRTVWLRLARETFDFAALAELLR